jgi:hypothetical protein
MKNRLGSGRRLAARVLLLALCLMLTSAASAQSTPGGGTPPPQPSAGASIAATIDQIAGLDATGNPAIRKTPTDHDLTLGLRDWLAVVLKGDTSSLDLTKAVLVLNGVPITGMTPSRYTNDNKAVIFHLIRTTDNHDAWATVLGSPNDWTRKVTVTLQFPSTTATGGAQIVGGATASTTFQLRLMSLGWLSLGSVVLLAVVAGVWYLAKTSSLLKDSLLPQLPPELQTFSLGRCQMAWWSVLIVGAFLFLLTLLWDYNTVTAQALVLMGISAATAVFAVQVDASKDSPIGRTNENLQALDLHSWDDVKKLKKKIEETDAARSRLKSAAVPDAFEIAKLEDQLITLNNKKRTYDDAKATFKTQGFWKDITTDVNGPALHRLQVVVWTVILGGVFVAGVYRDLAMPEFSPTLLALMGVANGAYLGFKFPEQQS